MTPWRRGAATLRLFFKQQLALAIPEPRKHEVKHPGERGGRGYFDRWGRWQYGIKPTEFQEKHPDAGKLPAYTESIKVEPGVITPVAPYTYAEQPDLASYDIILVNSSAGKDSAAMLDEVVRRAADAGVADRVQVVHADLGAKVEWGGVKELAERQAQKHGAKFHVVSRTLGDLLEQVKKRGKWPGMAPKARYCTAMQKTQQVAKLLTAMGDDLRAKHPGKIPRILNCIGLRGAENPKRGWPKRHPLTVERSNKNVHVDRWLPIQHWEHNDVWRRIKEAGIEMNPTYAQGVPRLSCVFCIFANRAQLTLAGLLEPDKLREYVAIEAQIQHTFKPDFSLADVSADIDKLLAEYGTRMAAIEHVQKDPTLQQPMMDCRLHDPRLLLFMRGGQLQLFDQGKPVQHPGIRGGKGYYTAEGTWVYGDRPAPKPVAAPDEWAAGMLARLIAGHGTTDDPGRTGFLLADGRRIPLNQAHDRSVEMQLKRFMEQTGAVRYVAHIGVEVATVPTRTQAAMIVDDFEQYDTSCVVDVRDPTDTRGNIAASKEFFHPTVDGIRHFVEQALAAVPAPEPEPVAPPTYQEVGTKAPAFKSWFGDWENDPAAASKVVDTEGEPEKEYETPNPHHKPLVLYHGSQAQFTEFDPAHIGKWNLYGPGFYFTNAREVVEGVYEERDEQLYFDTREEAEAAPGRTHWVWQNDPGDYIGAGKWVASIKTRHLRSPGYQHKGEIILDQVSREKIADGLRAALAKRGPGYITASEMENVERELKRFTQTAEEYRAQQIRQGLKPDPKYPFRPMSLGDLHGMIGEQPYNLPVFDVAERSGANIAGKIYPCYLNIRDPVDVEARPVPPDMFARIADVLTRPGSGFRWRVSPEFPTGRDAAFLRTLAQPEGDPAFGDKGVAVQTFLAALEEHVVVDKTVTRHPEMHYALDKQQWPALLKAAGYDGITHTGGLLLGGQKHRVWIAFDPHQIKAVDNAGTFDPATADIFKGQAVAVQRPGIHGGHFWITPAGQVRYDQPPLGGHDARRQVEPGEAEAIRERERRAATAAAAEGTRAVAPGAVPLDQLNAPHAPETLKAIYGRFGAVEGGRDTLEQLKIYKLHDVIEHRDRTQHMLDDLGFHVEEFAFTNDPEAGVKFRVPNLKTKGYGSGTLWIYSPKVAHGSFEDEEYTRQWRTYHEAGHGISEPLMQAKYGASHREGRLGVESQGVRGNPAKRTVPVTLRPLTLMEAQRAVEWEDCAFRIQRILLHDYGGVSIDDADFNREHNTNIADATFRVLTGDFGDPGHYGFLPAAEKAKTRDLLRFLQDNEEAIAKSQGRAPTPGIDLATWQPVSDDELRAKIQAHMKPLQKARVRRPGSRGGHYRVTPLGDIRYDDPHIAQLMEGLRGLFAFGMPGGRTKVQKQIGKYLDGDDTALDAVPVIRGHVDRTLDTLNAAHQALMPPMPYEEWRDHYLEAFKAEDDRRMSALLNDYPAHGKQLEAEAASHIAGFEKARAATRAKAPVRRPGARGGHYRITRKGQVRYDKPTPRPLAALAPDNPLTVAAKKLYGTTDNPREAAFILIDGTLLKKSDDHESMAANIRNPESPDWEHPNLTKFLRDSGAIRIQVFRSPIPEAALEFRGLPSREQQRRIGLLGVDAYVYDITTGGGGRTDGGETRDLDKLLSHVVQFYRGHKEGEDSTVALTSDRPEAPRTTEQVAEDVKPLLGELRAAGVDVVSAEPTRGAWIDAQTGKFATEPSMRLVLHDGEAQILPPLARAAHAWNQDGVLIMRAAHEADADALVNWRWEFGHPLPDDAAASIEAKAKEAGLRGWTIDQRAGTLFVQALDAHQPPEETGAAVHKLIDALDRAGVKAHMTQSQANVRLLSRDDYARFLKAQGYADPARLDAGRVGRDRRTDREGGLAAWHDRGAIRPEAHAGLNGHLRAGTHAGRISGMPLIFLRTTTWRPETPKQPGMYFFLNRGAE